MSDFFASCNDVGPSRPIAAALMPAGLRAFLAYNPRPAGAASRGQLSCSMRWGNEGVGERRLAPR
ncbi:MAG: hypothetical protein MUF34_10390 [Polyangiaceae bacterium]|nr:hypothetical protein [Polyangiaceae bacterium]